MAYFPNGSAGECFDNQCARCKYGQDACPISWVQMEHNYEAVGNPVATAILGALVKDNGECAMFMLDPDGMKQRGVLEREPEPDWNALNLEKQK